MNGAHLALTPGMSISTAGHRNPGIASFVRVVRAFAEASLAAVAFAVAILLIGLPIALVVRVVHDGVQWLAR